MTPAFIEKMKQQLEEERARLERDLGDMGQKDPQNPGQFQPHYPESQSNSEDDNALEMAEYSDDLSLDAKLEAELRDVKKALKSVEDGSYGICKYCHKEIDQKRLEARPTSSSCIACKKALTQEA